MLKDDLDQTTHDESSSQFKLDQMANQLSEAQNQIVNYVQKNPLKAIGFSVLGGALLAVLLRKHK